LEVVLIRYILKVMELAIRDDETIQLARELAERTGLSLPDVVTHALRAELGRMPPPHPQKTREERLARIAEIQARVRAAPVLDPRHPDDMLYDEDGLPK
jgi:antitoxin VapB